MSELLSEATGKTEGAPRDMQAEPAPLLRVYTFGAFELVWHTAPWTGEVVWESRTSARALFKLLLCAPGRQAPKSLLAGILWPEVDEERARESLRSACKVLRQVLRTAGGEELLVQRSTDDLLLLADQTRLWVDADAFENLVAQASRADSPEVALVRWEAAHALLRGEFLADEQSAEWTRHRLVKRRQQGLWMARCRLTRHLTDLYLQRGQTSRAEEMLEAHLLRFPADQDALYRFLLLLEQQGYFEEASILYERSRLALEAHGKQPAQHVRVLYKRFQQSISSGKRAFSAQTGITTSPVVPAPASGKPDHAENGLSGMVNPLSSVSGSAGPSENVLSALRALLTDEGREDMSLLSRRQLLELGIAAFITRLAKLDGKHISAVEREELGRALGQSIADGWKLFHRVGNAEILATGQIQLILLHQAHALVYPASLPYLYTGVYGLIGIALHFQERDEEALQTYHHGYMAALATGDPWYIVANLISQADCCHTLGQYSAAIQTLEEALRIIGEPANEASVRLKTHLLACWADNAMMLHDDRMTREKLDASRTYLGQLKPDEEFDHAAWLLIAGKYALNLGDYPVAKNYFEEALAELPEQWLLRRAMTTTGLAMAYARIGEREHSLSVAKDLTQPIKSIDAPMTNRWFTEYLQRDLLGIFPTDREVRRFVMDTHRQLPQQTSLLHIDQ